jgi:thiamine biosynthesis lipoprotein
MRILTLIDMVRARAITAAKAGRGDTVVLKSGNFRKWHCFFTTSLLLFFAASYGQDGRFVSVKRNMRLMGGDFEITVVAQNEEMGYINVDEAAAEIKRIEQLISSWIPESETSMINSNAGIQPVAVSIELYNLIERSIQISEITAGAFDITYATLDTLWKFNESMSRLPLRNEVEKFRKTGGYRNIVLNPDDHSVFLKNKGMRINFGGIGKGYAADRAKALLVSKQVQAGMINAAGDITAWGTKATGEKWLIGVANPIGNGNLITWIPLVESSVAISGNHRRFIEFNGKKYPDVLDPRSGFPVTGISKVTVFGKMAEFCDALGTAIAVLGTERGLALANQLGDTEVIIEEEGGGMYHSKGILLEIH